MKNISLLVMQLKNRQIQIDRKINQLIDQNLGSFPFEKLEKGKKLHDLILAGMHSKELGLKLDL